MRIRAVVAVAAFVMLAAGCGGGEDLVGDSPKGDDRKATWAPGELPPGVLGPLYAIDTSPTVPAWLSDVPDVQAVAQTGTGRQAIYYFDTASGVVFYRSVGVPCTTILSNTREMISSHLDDPDNSSSVSPPPVATDSGEPWTFECRFDPTFDR